jgi:Flp pilus assembly protein TadD
MLFLALVGAWAVMPLRAGAQDTIPKRTIESTTVRDEEPKPTARPNPEPTPAPLDREPATRAKTNPPDKPAEPDAGIREPSILRIDAAAAAAARNQLARERHADGMRQFHKKDYPRALQFFQDAYALDPRNAEIVNDLAYLYQVLGNVAEAERLYRETLALAPDRAIARTNLADLLHHKGAPAERLAEASQHLARARELRGNRPGIILRQARVAVSRGLFDEAARFYREAVTEKTPGNALRIEIGDFYRDFGRDDDALVWYRQVAGDEELSRTAAQRIWKLGVEREVRRYGWQRTPAQIPASARTLANKARLLFNQGRLADAERLLRRALRVAPHFPQARADLGDVLRDTGRREEAELAYLRALAFDQGNAEIYARLGKLYLVAPKAGRAAEASLLLARAIDLRPDWSELHFHVARAYRLVGDLPRALSHLDRFLALGGAPEDMRLARTMRAEIEPLVRGRSASAEPSARQTDASTSQAMARARVLLARGQADEAMAELRRIPEPDRDNEVLGLEARILYAAGRLEDAASTLRRALSRDDSLADAHELLGIVLRRLGRGALARTHLERAESLGRRAATYHLARLDHDEAPESAWGPARDVFRLVWLWGLRARLARFLERATSTAYVDEARALKVTIDRRITLAAALAGGTIFALLIASFWIHRRVTGGADLHTLLERHPEAGPDVQRILSAIRHEVLKHHTLTLTGLAEVLERGEPASEKAAHCQKSLFGAGGAESRLHAYAVELDRVGRAYGVRLNLRRRDAALSALLRGFREARGIASELGRIDTLGTRERARISRRLTAAAHLLNTEGYEAVRALLDRLRLLEIDEALLEKIFARTLAEPALAPHAGRIAPLSLEARALPIHVLIPRRAFEDIVQNLLRNALQSSLRQAEGGVAIGIAVDTEIDPITAVERATFRIRDHSPQELTAEMLRGRYIEEGLGLSADLVSRYDGTLDVATESPPWTKAVLVKLPLAEPAASEVEVPA